MRELLSPTKMNLATLGNVVPHLHWHLIARFDWDSHFPSPVWSAAQRERAVQREAEVAARLPALESRIIERLRSS
jgi:diadenosine tetraphosphate (Ap4A) HIT family hydrolase